MDDLQAIRRLKRGDIGGLEILITRYQIKAVRTAYLVTQNEPMAEDVVQDTFIRFYEHIHYFDEKRSFEPYFLSSVVNAARNAVEKESHAITFAEEDDATILDNLLARATSVEEQVQLLQMEDEILEALGRLSPRQRAVVVQRYYLEMSEKEMSEALGAAPGTVKWLLNAARNRLHTLLSRDRMSE
jgi:RNA polymerase sigma-70 factor, ECF subfamily